MTSFTVTVRYYVINFAHPYCCTKNINQRPEQTYILHRNFHITVSFGSKFIGYLKIKCVNNKLLKHCHKFFHNLWSKNWYRHAIRNRLVLSLRRKQRKIGFIKGTSLRIYKSNYFIVWSIDWFILPPRMKLSYLSYVIWEWIWWYYYWSLFRRKAEKINMHGEISVSYRFRYEDGCLLGCNTV
jgi:hypothetical protein